jgi:hypothetical protein
VRSNGPPPTPGTPAPSISPTLPSNWDSMRNYRPAN